jgi:two-component system chemotaxis response regulator CheB
MAAADAGPTVSRDLVVVGASAGGLAPLRTIASRLPSDFPACVLVVLHTGPHPSRLPQLLDAAGPLEASFATDGAPLRPGTIYVAPPDHHLLVRESLMRVTRGPKEHHTRPAIDPLFRSAALWGGPRVTGVVLSGSNDDGSAGLHSIKACGGTALVQDPDDAEEPVMPRSALRNVAVDVVVPADGIAPALRELLGQPVVRAAPVPEWLALEERASVGEGTPVETLRMIGRPSPLVCADCSGTLFELSGDTPVRYRCHTGHAYTLRTLQESQATATEAALWSAIRALQERETLLRRIAELDRIAGDEAHAAVTQADAERLGEQIAALRNLVESARGIEQLDTAVNGAGRATGTAPGSARPRAAASTPTGTGSAPT